MEKNEAHQNISAARLESLDALRGADMLCILGLDAFFYALYAYSPGKTTLWMAQQFCHKAWAGLAIYDLIFPLFVFISGAAMAFSLNKKRSSGMSDIRQIAELFRRGILLASIGFVLQGGLSFNFEATRFASVLALIGLSNAIGGTLAVLLKSPKRILIAVVILSGSITLAQFLGGDFSPENSVNAKIDRLLLPGKMHDGTFDPEGILCIVSASVSVLIGYLAGTFIRSAGKAALKPVLLAVAGTLLLGIAFLADNAGYPIIKKLWTQSFVFAAAGWSLIAFAVFYTLFDLLPLKTLAFPLRIIGINALAIYILQWIFPFNNISSLLLAGTAELCGNASSLVLITGSILFKWLLLYWLNRRAIYFKI